METVGQQRVSRESRKSLTFHLEDSNFVGLIEPISDVVEMHGTIKSNKSDLRPSISGQAVQLILNSLASDLQVAALLRQRRHVE